MLASFKGFLGYAGRLSEQKEPEHQTDDRSRLRAHPRTLSPGPISEVIPSFKSATKILKQRNTVAQFAPDALIFLNRPL